MVALAQHLERRGAGRHARREQQRVGAALEIGDHRFGLDESRILVPAVAVFGLQFVVRSAREGRRNMDRRDNRPGDLAFEPQPLRDARRRM